VKKTILGKLKLGEKLLLLDKSDPFLITLILQPLVDSFLFAFKKNRLITFLQIFNKKFHSEIKMGQMF